MDMHAAAEPPRRPPTTDKDRSHPLFPHYLMHVSACMRLLVDAPNFADWMTNREALLKNEKAVNQPEYPAFLAWMRETQGGRRPCPVGSFPANFYYWRDGGRW